MCKFQLATRPTDRLGRDNCEKSRFDIAEWWQRLGEISHRSGAARIVELCQYCRKMFKLSLWFHMLSAVLRYPFS